MTRLFHIALISLMILGVQLSARAQDTSAPSTEDSAEDPAIAFLKRLEAKNLETKSLEANFTQVRAETGFMDDEPIRSTGQFWYQAPDKFHASYQSENDSQIWMVDGKLISYVPGLKQVDIVKQPTGDNAPMNQMLLGFGAKVENITKLFKVSKAEAADDKSLFGIRFDSRNLNRSMGYDTITIYFDEQNVEPRRIILSDSAQTITIKLTGVKVNPELDARLFVPKWPTDVEVNDDSEGSPP